MRGLTLRKFFTRKSQRVIEGNSSRASNTEHVMEIKKNLSLTEFEKVKADYEKEMDNNNIKEAVFSHVDKFNLL